MGQPLSSRLDNAAILDQLGAQGGEEGNPPRVPLPKKGEEGNPPRVPLPKKGEEGNPPRVPLPKKGEEGNPPRVPLPKGEESRCCRPTDATSTRTSPRDPTIRGRKAGGWPSTSRSTPNHSASAWARGQPSRRPTRRRAS